MEGGALTSRMGSMTSFGVEEAPAAFEYLESGARFGKVVIRL
jgi:NADPH-dependent curcumin reductase CurA